MKLYTATIDYYATGEGRSMSFLAIGAEDEEMARLAFVERCGEHEYFMRGATIYEGLPPPGDEITMYLVSDPLYKFLKGQAENLNCNVVTRVAHHVNYS